MKKQLQVVFEFNVPDDLAKKLSEAGQAEPDKAVEDYIDWFFDKGPGSKIEKQVLEGMKQTAAGV